MTAPPAGMFNRALHVYRRALKPIRPLHAFCYRLGSGALGIASRIVGFRTNPADPLWWRLSLMTGSHERASRALFAEIVTPGMTVVDVGAHIGYYTTQFARLVGPDGRVIAFEPHPGNFELLAHNLARHRNVTLLNHAVSERAETVLLFDDMADTGGPSLRHDDGRAAQVKELAAGGELAPRLASAMAGSPVEVAAVRIDEALAGLGVSRVDVVKMDIEGAEMGALRGLERLLDNSPRLAVVLEFYPAALRPFGVEPVAVWRWLHERGFAVSRIIDDGSLYPLADERAVDELVVALDQTGSEANLLARRRAAAAAT